MIDYLNCARGWTGYVTVPKVKTICEGYADMSGDTALDAIEIIQRSLPFIFDFVFPIFDESHRQELETKIIKNYYFRGICCPDVEEWKLRLSNKLNMIMPYYNDLYKSNQYLVDIMDDVDYQRIIKEDTNRSGIESTKSTQRSDNTTHSDSFGTETATTDSKEKDMNRFSDTPQGELDSVENNTYLTNATILDKDVQGNRAGANSRQSDGTASTDSEGTFDTANQDTGKRDMTEHVKGKMGMKSKSAIVMEYRKAILNIDMEIVARLSDLFMSVYNTWD